MRLRHHLLLAPLAVALFASTTTSPLAAAAPTVDPRTAQTTPHAHSTLDQALSVVGSDQATFTAQSALADRLSAASTEFAARFPDAFAGVRMSGVTGEIGVVPTVADAEQLRAAARSRGFVAYDAARSSSQVAGTVARVDEWERSLPEPQREAVATTVDGGTGEVTVLVDATGPTPPAGLDVTVRHGAFRKAQLPSDGTPATDPVTTPVLGGERSFIQNTAGTLANYCSFGFNGVYQSAPVNITATHCSEFGGLTTFTPGVVAVAGEQTTAGHFTDALGDSSLDAAVITFEPWAQPRFAHNRVRSGTSTPLAITGYQKTVAGQVVCKSGQRTGFTCGTSKGTLTGSFGPTTSQKTLFDLCVIEGDSGGVIFSGDKAVGITSEANTFRQDGTSYTSCAEATAGLGGTQATGSSGSAGPSTTTTTGTGTVPQTIGIDIQPILDRFPGLHLRTS